MDQVATLPLPTTPEEFLAWEVLQEEKHEFDGRAPVPMNGGTASHYRIERNILRELDQRLEGTVFEAFGATMKVRIGRSYRYPDVSVTDVPVKGTSITVEAPLVLFEVMSPSTDATDRRVKLREYRSLPSLRRYVLVEQDECELTVYARSAEGWTVETLVAGDMLAMPEIGVTVSVDSLYKGVFPTP